MADKSEIEIVISPEGEVQVHVRGIKGPRCERVIKATAGESGVMKEFTKTTEYFEKTEVKADVKRQVTG